MHSMRFLRSLYVQVLIAIAIGILLGYFVPDFAVSLKPLGDAFIKLIKMIIAPIIFCTVVLGIAGMENLKSVGRTGAYALVYFEVLSTIALMIGLVVVNVVQPGGGMNIDPATLNAGAVAQFAGPGKMQTVTQFLLDIIPDTMVGAFAHVDILPVLFVAILSGFALHLAGEVARPLYGLVQQVSQVLFRIVGMIMKVAPIGAFGAMAFTIGKYGVGALAQLGGLMLCFYATCLLFIFGVLGIVARLHGFSIWRFVKYIRDELLIVLGTSSSEAVLPRMIAKLETLGAQKSVVGLVIPAGYSFNLDGTSIYLTMATLFIAQATNTPLDLFQQVTVLAILLLTSKGAAGVTGSGFIVLAATLSAVGTVPVAGVALILGIDRFMSEARALTNLVGNGVATLVVARWCGALDSTRLQQQLESGPPEEVAAT
ncbi:C4-dicarboxylic acid, orotate and citrate transporter [Burkholderiales bacterium]|nr:C4-dicarboxylic acid, orotate and citrate transporter [Burkholderiales bacterium]